MERFIETLGECRLFEECEECDREEGGKGRQERQ